MSYCDGLISVGIEDASCENRAIKGIERKAVLINRDDIDMSSIEYDVTNKNVVTALTLLSSKKGFPVIQKGQTPFTGSKSSGVVGTYQNSVTHNLVIAILNNDAKINDGFTDGILNGEFVAVVEFKDKGADNKSAFRVYGLDQGLTMSALEQDPYGDTYGGWLVTLTETEAPRSAVYLGNDYSTGKQLFDSLLSGGA